MITVDSFRRDLPEFANQQTYLSSAIVYFLNVAYFMLNANAFGSGAPFASVTARLVNPGAGYAAGDVVTIAGGTPASATTINVLTVGAGGTILTYQVASGGVYFDIPPASAPAGQSSTTGVGVGATFNMAYTYGLNQPYDLATEMFVAHHLALEQQAMNSANVGGIPGMSQGMVSSKSAGGVSISYDTGSTIDPQAGHWNLTTYGNRLRKMMCMFGAGPIQLGVGCDPYNGSTLGFLDGPGWPGPPQYPVGSA